MQYKILILIIFIHIGNIKAGLASDGSLTQTAESLTPEYNEEIIKHRLSETQTFWPEQPYTYEQGIKRILADFAEMPSGELEKRISHHIFKGIVETPIDSHQSNRDLLLRVKCNLILQCLNIPEINDDLLTWLDIARVHGDVQSYIIPNYTQQGGLTPFNAMDASSEEELHEILNDYQIKRLNDRWQQELRITDRKLTLLLENNVQNITSKMSENQKQYFVEKIISFSGFSEDEARALYLIENMRDKDAIVEIDDCKTGE